MNVLVIGAGMYVTGRNNSGNATIMSSLWKLRKLGLIQNVTVCSRSDTSKTFVDEAVSKINSIIGTDFTVGYFATGANYVDSVSNYLQTERPDACIISVPDDLHYSYAKLVLNYKVPCMIVKPFTSTVDEALELIQLQEKHNVHCAVEFHKRWDESNVLIKRLFKEKLGKPLYFTCDYSQRKEIPLVHFKDWAATTNIFQYLGVHYVDLLYFMSQYIPEKVMAFGSTGLLKDKGIDTFDSIHVSSIWKDPETNNELFATYNTNWIDPSASSAVSDQKYSIVGTEARIDCDQKHRGVTLVDNGRVSALNPYFSEYYSSLTDEYLDFNGYGFMSIATFFEDLKQIELGKLKTQDLINKRPSFQQSLISVKFVEAVNKSLKNNNQWVNI